MQRTDFHFYIQKYANLNYLTASNIIYITLYTILILLADYNLIYKSECVCVCVCVCLSVCLYVQDKLFNPLTDSNQILCSDYSEPGDKHITRILSLYLESRATPGI
jgi:hypothetical protein